MIGGRINGIGGIDGIIGRVRQLQEPDFAELAERLRPILLRGGERLAESGHDVQGRPLAPLAESTRAKHRRDGEEAEPLQHRGGSPFIADVEITGVDGEGAELLVSYDHPAARYHAQGTRDMPARDIFGLDDQTRAEVLDEVRDFASSLIGGDAVRDNPNAYGAVLDRP